MSIDPTRRGSSLLLNGDNLAPELGGDINARVAAMLLEQSQDRKDYLREARRSEEQHLRAVEGAEVQAIRDEAVHVRAAARSRAIGAMVSGGFQIAGGMVMAGSEGDAESQGTSSVLGGSGKAGEAIMGFSASNSDFAAGEARADAKAAENKGKESERRLGDIEEEVREARELAKTAIQFLRDAAEKDGEIQRAALFRA
jgi:hypothetical protein